MKVAGTCITGVADVGDNLALLDCAAFDETVGIAREVSVVKDELPVSAELIDRGPTALAVEEFENLAVGRGQYGCFGGGHYVYRVVNAPFRACIVEGVDKLVRPHTSDRDDQVYLTDEVCGFRCWGWIWWERRANSYRATWWKSNRREHRLRSVRYRQPYQRHDNQKNYTQQDAKPGCPHDGLTDNYRSMEVTQL